MAECGVSPTTGEEYYSGTWKDVQKVLSVCDIGEGRLGEGLPVADIECFQEMVDRAIDDILTEVYHVPLLRINQKQPDGVTRKVMPGSVVMAARYWAAGLIMMDQFQQLAENVTEQAQQYITKAQKDIYAIIRFNHRLYGQKRKSNISRTMPPGLQPPSFPEPNF
jgi:hypothetical protein